MQALTPLPNFVSRAGRIARRTASVRSPMPARSSNARMGAPPALALLGRGRHAGGERGFGGAAGIDFEARET